MIDPILRRQLEEDEGVELRLYLDAKGKQTIGIGHNLTDKGITREVVTALYEQDILEVQEELDAFFPWWRELSPVRQRALQNLCFNMGIGNRQHGLRSFVNMLAALQAGRYREAADHLVKSQWAVDVQRSRVQRIVTQIAADREPEERIIMTKDGPR